nr:hypothetical protein CFP56_36073 [Quercus suber]
MHTLDLIRWKFWAWLCGMNFCCAGVENIQIFVCIELTNIGESYKGKFFYIVPRCLMENSFASSLGHTKLRKEQTNIDTQMLRERFEEKTEERKVEESWKKWVSVFVSPEIYLRARIQYQSLEEKLKNCQNYPKNKKAFPVLAWCSFTGRNIRISPVQLMSQDASTCSK